MVKSEKILERMRTNPNGVRFDDLDNVLRRNGFASRQVGSHVTYTRGQQRVTVPYKLPHVLPIYVKQVLAALDAAEDEA